MNGLGRTQLLNVYATKPISFKNYQNKTLDYSGKFNEQVPEEKANFEHYKKIDLGKVYLDPE
ncbi:hypothetical protein APD42_08880 [Acinetobacter nosocomialis]|nr:hypothetical protein APD42_08880 [Acinetobacter nosocomialis]